jgi:hypothetical protein
MSIGYDRALPAITGIRNGAIVERDMSVQTNYLVTSYGWRDEIVKVVWAVQLGVPIIDVDTLEQMISLDSQATGP